MDRITELLEQVAALYDVTVAQIRSRSRSPVIVEARQAAMWVLHVRYPRCTLREIAAAVRRKDHSTVIHALRRVEERMHHDEWLEGELRMIARAPKPVETLYWQGPPIVVLAA